MSTLAFWSDDFNSAAGAEGETRDTNASTAAISRVPFVNTPETIKAQAAQTAHAWLGNPANKMTLTSLQKRFNTDGGGIDVGEFRGLLQASGSNASAEQLFAQMDADGDGQLTEAEIKSLANMKRDRR